jgi:hypothetical protein
MWQSDGFARTLSIEDISAVPAMMLAIGKGERCPTTHADI